MCPWPWEPWDWLCGNSPSSLFFMINKEKDQRVLYSKDRKLISKSKVKLTQTFCNLRDYTVPRILQARILECAAFPFSRGSSQPRDQAQVAHISGRFFTSWATRKAPGFPKCQKNLTSERGRKCGVKERKTAPLLTTFRLMAAAVESSWGKWAVYLTLCLQQKHLPITCGFSRTWEHMWTISGDHFYYQ